MSFFQIIIGEFHYQRQKNDFISFFHFLIRSFHENYQMSNRFSCLSDIIEIFLDWKEAE